jgi:glycosyltransferase involved in cell wall biosynthesis
MNNNDVTIIIPAKQESASLPIVLKNLEKYNFVILVIIDRTDIKTIESIKYLKHKLIFQQKKGYGDAIITGINSSQTKYSCIFNADGSFQEEDIIKMKDLVIESNLDFIFASRYSYGGGSSDDTILTYIGNKIFSLIGKVFFNLKVDDILYTHVFGLTDKFKDLKLKSLDFRLCAELPLKVNNFKMNYSNMGSYERSRIAGFKKVNEFKDGFLIILFLIKSFFKKF